MFTQLSSVWIHISKPAQFLDWSSAFYFYKCRLFTLLNKVGYVRENIILGRVRVTMVAVVKQLVLHKHSVCVCVCVCVCQ